MTRQSQWTGRAAIAALAGLAAVLRAGPLRLANAGHAVRDRQGRTFYAPFVRDDITAFGPGGDTLWSLRRGLTQETPNPRFLVRDGRPVLDYGDVPCPPQQQRGF